MDSGFSDSLSWAKPSLPQISSFSARMSQLMRHPSQPDATSQTSFTVLARFVRAISSRQLPTIGLILETGGVPASKRLGEGATYVVHERMASGTPRQVIDGVDSFPVAVKTTKVTVPKNLRSFGMSAQEVERLKAILTELEILTTPGISEQENIASLLGYSYAETTFGYVPSIVMELATLGNCRRFTSSRSLSDDEKLSLCRDISCGLSQLHAFKIVHGDVKQDNVLIYPNEKGGFVAKIADFERSPSAKGGHRYTGTKAYNAPELKSTCAPKPDQLWRCDVYSFGLLSLEIMSGASRYEDIPGGLELKSAVEGTPDPGACHALEISMKIARKCPAISQRLISVCLQILNITLPREPLRRVPRGWVDIHNILERAQPFVVLDWGQGQQDQQGAFLNDRTDFSLLELCHTLPDFGKDILGPAIWADLEHIAANSSYTERGRALFNLFLCYSTRNHTPVESAQEAFDCLAMSAEAQYGPAFITGTRIFQANGMNVPDIFLGGPESPETRQLIRELEDGPKERFYCEAVRRLWPIKLRRDIHDSFPPLGDESWAGNPSAWIREQRSRTDPDVFQSIAVRDFLLHRAVVSGNQDACELLLESACIMNSMDCGVGSLVQLALRCADDSMVFTLLRYVHVVDWFDDQRTKTSPLHWLILLPDGQMKAVADRIVSCSHTDCLDSLLNSKANGYFDELGLCLTGTPLSWAIECRNKTAVQVLMDLDQGAKTPRMTDVSACLGLSIQLACPEIAEYLLKRMQWKGSSTEVAIQKQSLTKSICHGRSVSDFSRWLMHGSAYAGIFGEMLDLLERYDCHLPIHLEDDLNPPQPGDIVIRPLSRAVMTYNFYLVKELLKRGADPNEQSWTNGEAQESRPLECAFSLSWDASISFSEPVIALLLQHGAVTRPKSGSTLRHACEHGIPEKILRTVLNSDPSQLNVVHYGDTPLLRLIRANEFDDEDPENLAKLRLLVEAGADLHVQSGRLSASTPLGLCLWHLEWRAAEYLLSRAAPVQFGVTEGQTSTILHLMICRSFTTPKTDLGDSEKVILIIRRLMGHETTKKQDLINIPNWKGSTPLKMAVSLGLQRTVTILLEGASHTPKEVVFELHAYVCQLSSSDLETWPSMDEVESCLPFPQALNKVAPFAPAEYHERMNQIKAIIERFMGL